MSGSSQWNNNRHAQRTPRFLDLRPFSHFHSTPLIFLPLFLFSAYYYEYGPARAEYIKNIWSIINWKNVAERFAAAKGGK